MEAVQGLLAQQSVNKEMLGEMALALAAGAVAVQEQPVVRVLGQKAAMAASA